MNILSYVSIILIVLSLVSCIDEWMQRSSSYNLHVWMLAISIALLIFSIKGIS